MTNPVPRIAVLDDDENWCLAVKRFFRASYEVSTFTDVQSFLASPIESYDLVIVDFTIAPNHRYEQFSNGIEVIQQLKAQITPPPLTMLTSAFISRNDLTIDSTLRTQADAIMPKDCGLDEILQTAKAMLNPKNNTGERSPDPGT